MRKTLQELEKSVSTPLMSKNSNFFHEITDVLLVDYLLFTKIDEVYQIDADRPSPATRSIEAKNMDEVSFIYNNLLSEGLTPANCARRLRYERLGSSERWGNDRVATFSHHKSLEDLTNGMLRARSILSTTDFDLGKRKLGIDNVRNLFSKESQLRGVDTLAIAFERDYIVITQDQFFNNLYSLHPRYLYEAAKKHFNP